MYNKLKENLIKAGSIEDDLGTHLYRELDKLLSRHVNIMLDNLTQQASMELMLSVLAAYILRIERDLNQPGIFQEYLEITNEFYLQNKKTTIHNE